MAIFHLELKVLPASKAFSAAAYRAREYLRDKNGRLWSPRHSDEDLRADGIALPAGSPAWAIDRTGLWDGAVDAERIRKRGPRCGEIRNNARVGRTLILALPAELNDGQRRRLADAYAHRLAARYGGAVDWAVHAPDKGGDQRNHHLHLAITDRKLGVKGFGEKIRCFSDRRQGPQELTTMRTMWEREVNAHLEQAGHSQRVDSRSLADRGVRRPSGVHLGAIGHIHPVALERKAANNDRLRQARLTAMNSLSKQIGMALAAEMPEQARVIWRMLLENARDALADPYFAAFGQTAFAVARWALRQYRREAKRNRLLLDRARNGLRADGHGARPFSSRPFQPMNRQRPNFQRSMER